jgi:geranylgeranyl diphosphate synthase type I
VADKFSDPTEDDYPILAQAFRAMLPEAERCLDDIADEARREALECASDPRGLIELVQQTRALSSR